MQKAKMLVALSVLVSPALAQAGASSTIIEPSADQQAESKVLCKYEANSGSRFQTRVCHTNKQWADIREQSMREMREQSMTKFGQDDRDPHPLKGN